jgi:hypothetical protein
MYFCKKTTLKMKKIIYFCLFCMLLCITACKKKHPSIHLQKIEYDVMVNNYANSYSWFDHIEGFSRIDLFTLILQKSQSGDYVIKDMNNNEISSSEIDKLLKIQLFEHEDSSMQTIQLNAELLNGIRFLEEWHINEVTGFIEKNVIAFAPLYYSKNIHIDESNYPKSILYSGYFQI